MSIPLAYNLRNLVVRKTTTIMTALGIGLTVAVLLAVLSMVDGLQTTLAATGDPLQIVVLRKGSESEIVSNFTREQFRDLLFTPGIAVGQNGQPLASLEVVSIINLSASKGGEGTNIVVRGLQPAGLEMRHGVKIVSGRWFEKGHRELVVGKEVAAHHPEAALGRKVRFGRGDWDIVGVMDAGRGAQGSEIWGDLDQVASDLQRMETLSSALVRASDPVAAQALMNSINNDQRLNMNAVAEPKYYAAQTASAAPIEYIGNFVAIIMAIGSGFAAMNTMYAAVSRRSREIGTLRVLGFSKGSILTSFFLESVLLSAIGGVLGCLMVLPLNGMTTRIGNSNFAETAFGFHVSLEIMLIGIAFAVSLGAIGGLFPASNAARKEILVALRQV
jgi:putative ABC transport system permease protein